MDKPEVNQKRAYLYTTAPDYGAFHATGVWGGITPTGEIQMTFFEDTLNLPSTYAMLVTNIDGNRMELSADTSAEQAPDPARTIQCSITLPASFIANFIDWLSARNQQLSQSSPTEAE